MATLILDDDLGFVMWLGRVLNDDGLQAFPACRGDEALALIERLGLSTIELLIANFELPDSRGLVEALAKRGEKFKLIAIGRKGSAGRRKIHARIVRPPAGRQPVAAHYLKIVRRVL